MEPSGSKASEAQSKDKGNVPVIDVDSENVNQRVDEHIDEHVSDHVDEQKKRRYKSFVWDHFPCIEGATEAKCPYCGTVLAANSKQNGTSTLDNHLINVCVTSPLYRSKDKKKQTKLSFKPATMGESGGTLVSHSFNQERCRKAVARMCIKDNQPFSIVEDEGFSKLVWELNSEFKLPSRKLSLSLFTRMAFTRVFTVTVDNASSNDGAIRRLCTLLKGPNAILYCKYMHLRCCAHIINLVVRDGLEEQHSSIYKIQNAVKYLISSSGRQESFENGVKFEKVDCKRKPCLDVDTRWNSTFLMLETAVKFEKVSDRLELTEHDYTSYFNNEIKDGEEGTRMIPKTKKKKKNVVGVPNENDWSNARIENIILENHRNLEDDCSMKIDLDDGFSKYLETQYGEGDDYTEVDVYLKDGAEKRGDNSFDVLEHILTLMDFEHKHEAPSVENLELASYS
uniref:Zinc finger BED domain-containing protein RICESLEEPER 2-like n=1 Tax=Tanacetum cinerariifolium TaxID=118510 RepID=A0A6L2LKD6_TANCI|nr:zinc finger BED domain-containing protein RICESLEEPER 2-like [Tanacetum cinerariifolium]